ncbi:MAG: sodium/solute symporter [Sphingomonadales bacterium]|jgi:SSS family transporter
MNGFDYTLVVGYLVALVGLGYFYREQLDRKDYFLGGRSMGWFPLALSTMATQLSAISFISAPAFVGIREGGGLIWLSYELAVPLAMVLLMWVIMPKLYNAGFVSIYEFLEDHFDKYTRFLISVVFQVSRAFGTGITIYAVALILENLMGLPFWVAVSIVGVVTAVYSLQGGMKAVVYADAAQMIIIFIGIFLCAAFGLYHLGGVDVFLDNLDTSRLDAVKFSSLGFNGDEFGLFPMLFGGLVLYASYYGCDQTQAQRIISAKDGKTVSQILLANGLLRFPMVLLYCIMGLIVGTLFVVSPDFSAQEFAAQPDRMIPTFIVTYLPHGIIGVLVVAILASAMSSLSSVINSLSAVTIEDLAMLRGGELSEKQYVFWSRFSALFWSVLILGFSFFGGSIASTVIEAINKVGSMFYGPILAVFLLAIGFRNVSAHGANWGILSGVGLNFYLWLGEPQIFWFWWNVTGLVSAILVALLVSRFVDGRKVELAPRARLDGVPKAQMVTLVLAFAVILTIIIGIGPAFRALAG